MKERLKRLPLKALSAVSLALCFAPVNVLLGRRVLPACPAAWYLLPMLALVWGIAGYLLPARAHLPFALAGCALLAAGVAGWLLPSGWQTLLLLVPCWAVLLLLPPAYAREAWQEWPIGLWTAGVVLHLAGQVLASRPGYSGTAEALAAVCAAFAFLLLLTVNRQSLRVSVHGGQQTPVALRRRSLALMIAVFALALVIACWQALSDWLSRAGHAVLLAIGQAIAWLMHLFAQEESASMGGGGGGTPDLSALGEAAEPSALARLLEKIAMVLAVAVLLVLVCVVCRILLRKLRALVRRLGAFLRRYAAASCEEYVDEAESTLHLDEKTRALRNSLKRRLTRAPRQTPWQQLDGRARVRRLYQQYLHRHPDARRLTAREALHQADALPPQQASAFAELYEQARYSDHPIDPAAADGLRDTLK